jgi:hypothetical protein
VLFKGFRRLVCPIVKVFGYYAANVLSNVTVSGTTQLDSNLNVVGTASLSSNLVVTGTASLNSNATVYGAMLCSTTLTSTGTTQLNSNLNVVGTASFNSNIIVTGTASLNSNATVSGAMLCSSTLTSTGTTQLNSNLNVVGTASFNSNIIVTGTASMNSNATVSGSMLCSSTLTTTGTAQLNSNLNVVGTSSLSSNIIVTGTASLNSNIIVTGTASLNSNATVSGAMLCSTTLTTTGTTQLNSNLNVVGTTSLSSNLVVTGYVGIGTNNPGNILHVGSAAGFLRVANSNSDYTLIGISNADGSSNTRIVLSGFNRTEGGAGAGGIEYFTTSNGGHRWLVQNSNEAMWIASNGNVGFGTSAPRGRLDLGTLTGNRGLILYQAAGINDDHDYFGFGVNSSILRYQIDDVTSSHIFYAGLTTTSSKELMRITGTGLVGIGQPTPLYPLDVLTSINKTQLNVRYFDRGTALVQNNSLSNRDISIRSDKSIWISNGGSYLASSDMRIKTNILDIEDDECLQQIRNIRNVKYKYIDEDARGSSMVYGFLAQQVEEYIPHAVSYETNIIPDIFCIGTVTHDETYSYIDIGRAVNNDAAIGDTVRFIEDVSGKDHYLTVVEVNGTTIKVSKVLELGTRAFVYGKRVNDFHVLDKHAIYTVAVGAVQEMDRKIQSLETRLATVESAVAALTAAL